ncbi:hypothetical protein [Komagataeibacter swingsii]|uniref:Uncharacterized protein n=1 Tax=Komagataeibacter swingsii TaxID=215220 RepID=A0A2V4R3U8_9PROT|nr:hypothetical protein [Komagataeibacter swingsii]PYD70577.1 hypothetical protein CFR76_04270 [Komagataeibacter swingsii]GBQ59014.1 hypothetical protein AA16373_1440 [Komagataeibacter swingsii DSM 16373]
MAPMGRGAFITLWVVQALVFWHGMDVIRHFVDGAGPVIYIVMIGLDIWLLWRAGSIRRGCAAMLYGMFMRRAAPRPIAILAHKRLFENNPLIKNNKSFWVLPFFQKGGVLSKLLQKASPKTSL